MSNKDNKDEGLYLTFNICKLQVEAGDSNTTRLRNHQISLETRRDMKRLSTSSSSTTTSNDDDSSNNNK